MFQNQINHRITNRETSARSIYKDKGFTVQVSPDVGNKLLWVIDYEVSAKDHFYRFLWKYAHKHNLGKIIFPVRPYDLYLLKDERFVMEGYIDGFFAGAPGCILAGYPQPRRVLSASLAEEQRALSKILTLKRKKTSPLPAGIQIRQATENEASALGLMLKINQTRITSALKKGYLCLVAWQEKKVIGAATAEHNFKYARSEITHCTIIPEYRDNVLLSAILESLQEKCHFLGIKCVYSLVKSSSYRMSLALHRAGYLFRGTLINNCYTAGQFENINIWVSF